MKTTIDDGFVGRVYKASAVLGGFGALASWAIGGPCAAAGWILGAAFSVAMLRVSEWAIRQSFVPGARSPQARLGKITLVKFPATLIVLGLAVWIGRYSVAFIAAFCVGVALTQVVIVLKVLGMLIAERLSD